MKFLTTIGKGNLVHACAYNGGAEFLTTMVKGNRDSRHFDNGEQARS